MRPVHVLTGRPCQGDGCTDCVADRRHLAASIDRSLLGLDRDFGRAMAEGIDRRFREGSS